MQFDTHLVGTLAVRSGFMESNNTLQAVGDTFKAEEILSTEIYKQLRDAVQLTVRSQFSFEEIDPAQARSPVVREKFNKIVEYQIREKKLTIKEPDVPVIADKLFSDILGYGPLEKYFNDPNVTEIKVNGKGLEIRVEKNGKETLVPEKFESIEQGVDLVRRMISKTGKRIDQAEARVDARLHDGSRMKAHIAPYATDDLLISIRRFRQDIDKFGLINKKAVSPEVLRFLEIAVRYRRNMMIAGSTSSGKTTWLNNLASFIDPSLSIITIENPAELQLPHPDVRRLEARGPNIEGKGAYTLSDAVQDALRMAPDIIILGEVLGKEAFDLLQAMGTGHEGSLGTAHANSAEDLLNFRMPDMLRMANLGMSDSALLKKIANILHFVVYVTQDETGRRRLDHIVEVAGVEQGADGQATSILTNRLWDYDPDQDTWKWVAEDFRHRNLFIKGGFDC